MKGQKFLRILIFLSFFVLPTPSEAQVGRLLKEALTGIQTRWERIILRETASSLSATKAITPFIFAPGQPLPTVPSYITTSLYRHAIPQQPNEMYRGMLLDENGEQLRHILRNGLETSKTFSYLRESYDGKKYPMGTKAIFASTWLDEAVAFANPYYADDPKLSVVFHLKRVGDTSLVQVPHDIPPSWIYQVSVWLQIDGKPRWGQLEMDENDNLIFKPYPEPKP